MKVYTKSGDKGETSLVYGKRVSKASAHVEAYGTCDEANSMIGFAFSFLPEGEEWKLLQKTIHIIQTKLFHIGAELSTPTGKKVAWPMKEEDVAFLEEEIDRMEKSLPPLTNFILPGGSPIGASIHCARTIIRRAERCTIALHQVEAVNPIVIKYLNRLSDYLFVLARFVNHRIGTIEPTLHQS
jgi:cob(I)alamin adenosyltransferase